MGKKYTIYRHTSPSGKVYIGITTSKPEYRWNNGKGYRRKDQPLFHNAILKYGWNNIKHKILFRELDEERAKRLEISLIRHYKGLGCSYNITDGGDGTLGAGYTHVGWKHSAETKKYFSSIRKGTKVGKNNPMYGRHKNNPAYGKFGENHPASKRVYQYTKEGLFIREWMCLSDVERILKIKVTHITACCNGRQKTAGGYVWKREKLNNS